MEERRAVVTAFAVAVGVALSGCASAPRAEPAALRAPALRPCRVPEVKEELLCATVDVPEDRARPMARRLGLHVVVVPSRAGPEGARGTPLFELQGGPGVAAATAAPYYAGELARVRELGDVVLVDQRGTGDSAPLVCPELDDAPPTAPLYPAAAVARCRASLEGHADLRRYGTADAVQDLEDVRAALGYERINLTGLSYGTRVAQAYLRAYPERTRAVVLDGVVPMDAKLPSEHATNAARVLTEVIDACAREPPCAAAFPKLGDELTTLTRRAPPDIDGGALTESIRHALYAANGASKVPLAIHALAGGNFAAFRAGAAQAGGGPVLREAVLLSVTCSEDMPFVDLAAAGAASRATFFGDARIVAQARACAAWPHAPVPAETLAPVASRSPILVLAGERDPVTPPSNAERATRRMPRAVIVRVPGMGHLPDGMTHTECLDGIVLAYLRDPSAKLDTSCVAQMKAPPFAVR
jgi:pimeloyl-ACP methyl ester carboxylesterase